MSNLIVEEPNAAKAAAWIKERNGILVWDSLNLSDPGQYWLTPATKTNGDPADKPHWAATNNPILITDPNKVDVVTYAEAMRFRVALRRGSQGLTIKLTDAATAKVRKALEAAGPGAIYAFDYDTQEAVIMNPSKTLTMSQWIYANQISAGEQA